MTDDDMERAADRAEWMERDLYDAYRVQHVLSELAPELVAPPITEDDRCPMCNRRATGICRGCTSDMAEQARELRRGY